MRNNKIIWAVLTAALALALMLAGCNAEEKTKQALVNALEAEDPAAFTAALEKVKEENRETMIRSLPITDLAAALNSGADFGGGLVFLQNAFMAALHNAAPDVIIALNAQAAPGGDFTCEPVKEGALFEGSPSGVRIIQYTGENTVLVIPAEIDGQPVIAVDGKYGRGNYPSLHDGFSGWLTPREYYPYYISLTGAVWTFRYRHSPREERSRTGNWVFYLEDWKTEKLKTEKAATPLVAVVIPDGVLRIGMGAFAGETMLRAVKLPDSVRNIQSFAFIGCTNLTSINLPASDSAFRYKAFAGCAGLVNIAIPDDIKMPRSREWVWNNDDVKFEWGKNSKAFEGCDQLPLATRQRLKDLGYNGVF